MKIKSIKLKNFKRFTDLTIEGLPETAKLVVMIGPNGCGKSSVFEGLKLRTYLRNRSDLTRISDNYYQILEYYFKFSERRHGSSYYKNLARDEDQRMSGYPSEIDLVLLEDHAWRCVNVEFHGRNLSWDYEWDKCVRARSAYRNYTMTHSHTINRDNPLKERRLVSLIENDEAVASNYWRLASLWLERSSEIGQHGKSLAELQDEILGELRGAICRLFNDPKLVLKNLGHPADGGFFQFDKGTSERFSYQNLASGEKAALDLLLDVIVTKAEYDETIICIDEPESHMHTKLQGQLLEELYNLIPDKSQLWIATHSIGMVRKARDLWRKCPKSVVFLNFDGHDFDEPVTLIPTPPDSNLWARIYEVALADLSELVVPEQIVLCEGKIEDASEGFDAECYNQIFERHHPETRFVSIGGRKDVENAVTNLVPVISEIAKSAKIVMLRDRDNATDSEKKRYAKKGIRTLSRQTIESYLIDDEVLTKLGEKENKPDKVEELRKVVKDPADVKSIVQALHHAAQKAFKPSPMGNNRESFMRDILAPLIQPCMAVYKELHDDIFGE